MLRKPNQPRWQELVPAYARRDQPMVTRKCPDCSATYDARDRYCPRCHSATPEWRYG